MAEADDEGNPKPRRSLIGRGAHAPTPMMAPARGMNDAPNLEHQSLKDTPLTGAGPTLAPTEMTDELASALGAPRAADPEDEATDVGPGERARPIPGQPSSALPPAEASKGVATWMIVGAIAVALGMALILFGAMGGVGASALIEDDLVEVPVPVPVAPALAPGTDPGEAEDAPASDGASTPVPAPVPAPAAAPEPEPARGKIKVPKVKLGKKKDSSQ